MPDENLQKIASQIGGVDAKIAEAKDYIRLLKSVGEDASGQEARLTELQRKSTKWRTALSERGYNV